MTGSSGQVAKVAHHGASSPDADNPMRPRTSRVQPVPVAEQSAQAEDEKELEPDVEAVLTGQVPVKSMDPPHGAAADAKALLKNMTGRS